MALLKNEGVLPINLDIVKQITIVGEKKFMKDKLLVKTLEEMIWL